MESFVAKDRIDILRHWMEEKGLDAFIIPSSDPHMSEYVAPRWKTRAWFSGFTGSAGTLAVTMDKAGLWTDSRYFLQAEAQLAGSGIELMKMGFPDTPDCVKWVVDELSGHGKAGFSGELFSVNEAESMIRAFSASGLDTDMTSDPACLMENRPSVPLDKVELYDVKYSGENTFDKLERVRQAMMAAGTNALLLCALDEIAWVCNLRGTDVKCNPLFVSFMLLTEQHAVLFVEEEKLDAGVREYLDANGIGVCGYGKVYEELSRLKGLTVAIDPDKTNYNILQSLAGCEVKRVKSFVATMKAVRNDTEKAGLHEAMKRDGVALVRFLKWLEENVASCKVTEVSAAEQLHKFRAMGGDMFRGDSFDTIAGYADHAAIVHYCAKEDTAYTLRPEGMLLLDSGAQYLDGTTDVTRTIALGNVSEAEKLDYTLVLKGHIALARAKFPEGTRGTQLDVLARMPMWKRGANFYHGTGHGVGHYLCVHEGPQAIRMNEVPVALLPGMVVSDEPGIYRAGRHGVRIENLLLVEHDQTTEYGEFYGFETVTLCPYDTECMITSLLTDDERGWINSYHERLYELLSPMLAPEEAAWLRRKTERI